MERIVCPNCRAIHRDSVNGRCPLCGAELITSEQWQAIRTAAPKERPVASPPVPKWGLKFLLGVALACAAFAVVVYLATM